MGQGQEGGTSLKGTQAWKREKDAWTSAPSRCTPTCYKAARPTPLPPTSFRSSRSCQSRQPVSLTGIRTTSGRSSTSALGVRRSHPQLGSPLGGPAPLLGRLRLLMRRLSGGCNWLWVTARQARMCHGVAPWGRSRAQSFLPGASGAQGQPASSCLQARGRRRLFLPFGRGPMEEPPGKPLSYEEKEKVPGCEGRAESEL